MADNVTDLRVKKLHELVENVKLYKNPQELEDLKKLIKKNVPLSMRGYLCAYLLATSSLKISATKPAINKEDSVSFYINVGKASRGPAKDLVQFICENANLAAEDVVSLAYKQNYSFVSIKKAKADGVIENINGKIFKGRKVKINFSKEKDAE